MLGLSNAFSPSIGQMPCVTITSYADVMDTEPQPLDLSVPKLKTRQHWSGGSIIEENSVPPPPDPPNQCTTNTIHSPSLPLTWYPSQIGIYLSRNVFQHPYKAVQDSGKSASPVKCQPEAQTPVGDLYHAIGAKAHERITHFIRNYVRDVSYESAYRQLASTVQFLQSSGYYYSNLNWEDSLKVLKNTEVGTFLVRDSSDPRYLFSLSMQTHRGPTSVRIHYIHGTFRLDAEDSLQSALPDFNSVSEMVDFYVTQWKTCHQSGQVWIDCHGAMYSTVVLTKPLLNRCPSLQHLCRLALNRDGSQKRLRGRPYLTLLPRAVQNFLHDYPFQH